MAKKEKTLYEAYEKGFLEGMMILVSVLAVPEVDIQEKFKSKELILAQISESYHKWMGFKT